MKSRTLILLLIVLVALAMFISKLGRRSHEASPTELGQRVLHTKDINAVERIELTSGTQQVVLARTDGEWVVGSLWDYPAQFEPIAALLRQLDQLRVGEVIRGGTEILDEFGLAESATSFPVRVKLFESAGVATDDLLIGLPRTSSAMPAGYSMPDSRYYRSGDGEVVIAEPFVEEVRRRPTDWIVSKLPSFGPGEIGSMSAYPTNGVMYALDRDADGTYSGAGALTGKVINVASAEIWFRSLQNLSTRSIVDPATDAEALARGAGGSAVAHLTNGIVVRVELGALTPENMGHYGWLTFTYEEPPALEHGDEAALAADRAARDAVRAEAEKLQAQYGHWNYVFDYSQATKLLFLPDQLIVANAAPPPLPPAAKE
ncbi:MAG: DUF4340 domain-containing protein [Kiritimatiellae bacterium]|nr:DUF4340 domain-containing protein [Kiritimatiellia bacterium]MCO5068445.1 DUF4340 domain-containing protein [Kiritimatiellia bacterium]